MPESSLFLLVVIVIESSYYRIVCDNERKPGRVCNGFIGAIPVDTPSSAYLYCKNCNVTYHIKSDGSRIVSSHRCRDDERITFTASAIKVIEQRD